MRGISGRRIVVCGASRGIGLAVAQRLAEDGAILLLADRNEAGLRQSTAAFSSAQTLTLETYEQGDPRSVERLVARIDDWGQPEAICIVAGVHPGLVALGDVTAELMAEIHAVNVLGATLLASLMLSRFRAAGRGSLVAIGSVAGLRPEPRDAIYASSKAALHAAMTSFSQEVAASGVRVNTILPGIVDTPLFRSQLERPEEWDEITATIPARRIGFASEVAAAAAFLLSDDASYITGVQLVVDGGLAVGHD
jgi:NAD(P)-dependent dehydrogenase (short-subunit alcohol dehydrogenase family)